MSYFYISSIIAISAASPFLATSLVFGMAYFMMWIFGYELRFLEIPYLVAIVNLIVWFIHLLNIVRNKLLGK